ncbi:MAG: UDP-N-acetylmuramoyl-L-alanine--D-glutamate ligase [Bacteroidales bacterium]|nr:UDP-N-acetylmuramoyl-L-alanine--D-glutamate ligase [Bacteroidales bacterium]
MKILQIIEKEKVLLLGFGREGKSSYHFIRQHFPDKIIAIADKNESVFKEILNDKNIELFFGENYLEAIAQHTFVLKSPGISLKNHIVPAEITISSQTDLFIQEFHEQIIGITGTKGKSTTANLVYHILKKVGRNALIAGNMGIPLFDIIENITYNSILVCEFSSHQLEFVQKSPHISILLNFFQEHLDFYKDYESYQLSKYNIAKHQTSDDIFIYPKKFELIEKLIQKLPLKSKIETYSDSERSDLTIIKDFFIYKGREIGKYTHEIPLKGKHNALNIAAALLACLHYEKDIERLFETIKTFSPLPHRMEFVGNYHQIGFYNDSIATIPEASIQAILALKNVGTLILGGYDRGIDYSDFMKTLAKLNISNLIFTGEAGQRMMKVYQDLELKSTSTFYFCDEYSEIIKLAFEHTPKGKICLLSPAASSFDKFDNFEHRGDVFKKLITSYIV